MAIGKLTSIVLLTLVGSCLLAQDGGLRADTGKEAVTDQIGDLGASYRSVYFNSGEYSPHVGISVSYTKILRAVVSALTTDYAPSELESLLSEAVKDAKYWNLETEKLSFHDLFHLVNSVEKCQQEACTFPVDTTVIKPVVKAILTTPGSSDVTLVLDGRLYFGDAYFLAFDLPRFIREKFPKSQQPIVRIVHGIAPSMRVALRLSNRHDLALKGSAFPVDATLLTVRRDENGNIVLDSNGNPVIGSAKARRFDIDFTYLGIKDPFDGESQQIPERTNEGCKSGLLRSARINDGSIITMRIDATVSEIGLDEESSIAIIFDSLQVQPDLSPKGAGFRSYKLSTQQSLHDTTFLVAMGTRFGDHRAHSRKNEGFQPFSHVKGKIYLEAATEMGFRIPTGIEDVPRDNRGRRIILRPRLTLGFSDSLDSPWSVVGECTLYPLLVPEISGTQDKDLRLAEYVSIALIHRHSNSLEAFIKYEFGYNPDAKFALLMPSLNIGARHKF